jgi:hypothetical protein
MKLDAGGSNWEPITGSNLSLSSSSSVSVSFSVKESAYYAVFATLPPLYSEPPLRRELPPPAADSPPEAPPDYTSAIVGGVLGAMSLMCLIACGVWRWRKSRKHAILAMYYKAVSKSKTKLPPFSISKRPTVPPPAASAEHPDATGSKHLERPPPPVSADSPAGSRPNVWKAVNRLKLLAPLPSPALTPIEQPPLPTVDQRSGAGSRDKSLLA